MKRALLIVLTVIFISMTLLPSVTLAGCYYLEDGTRVEYKGLVPCGKSEAVAGESDLVTMPCQFCHLLVMIEGVVDFVIIYLVPSVAVLLLVIGGLKLFLSFGNPAKAQAAFKTITYVFIGLAIVYAAWMIVNVLLAVVGIAETNFGTSIRNWFNISCPIK